MYLIKNGVSYTLPTYAALNGLQAKFRNSDDSKMFQHGGINTADNKMDSREIEIGIFIDGQNQSDYFSQVNELKRYLSRPNQQLYITDDMYINISSIGQIEEEFYDGFYLVKAELTITLKALDPFFYRSADETFTEVITETDHQFTVNNPGSADTPVIITMTANELCDQVVLTNNTDSNRVVNYADSNFRQDSVLRISTIDGTVLLDGNNTINNFTGTFLRLLPGDNIFTYQGGACVVKIDYPVRWI